jgi:hypothetical protein
MKKDKAIQKIGKKKKEINSKLRKGHGNHFSPALQAAHGPPDQIPKR